MLPSISGLTGLRQHPPEVEGGLGGLTANLKKQVNTSVLKAKGR